MQRLLAFENGALTVDVCAASEEDPDVVIDREELIPEAVASYAHALAVPPLLLQMPKNERMEFAEHSLLSTSFFRKVAAHFENMPGFVSWILPRHPRLFGPLLECKGSRGGDKVDAVTLGDTRELGSHLL